MNQSPVPNLLTIQDMSSVGRCSLTVMLPIAAALGCQAIPLPTAVLCNHLEYPRYELVDFTDSMTPFMNCWQANGITFDGIQSGFLASPEQIHLVIDAIDRFATPSMPIIVDPAMADHGRLYSVYTSTMVEEMRTLISRATIIKPNFTEASFLLDRPYSTDVLSQEAVADYCRALHAMGPRYIILSSVPAESDALVAVYDGKLDLLRFVRTPLLPVTPHGSGDIFTAVLSGAILKGADVYDAAHLASVFTTDALRYTVDSIGSLRDGLLFEPLLHRLTNQQW